MPMVALLTCILIGWVVKPKVIIDEVTLGGYQVWQRKALCCNDQGNCTVDASDSFSPVRRIIKRKFQKRA